eukprot:CAMPEP_0172592120 /NCGR_PEP_ID=MMETSP1068-20121228/10977_1 /TAXON_ID=35684 /ORGANISM="Pseudopedinella elastica, Strain CCMP716" /LENGTH=371 /DNA_ID=CAMNT_0013388925 /DNA_START=42 /DNA_END=1157 /DNA_ORIENTATION=+
MQQPLNVVLIRHGESEWNAAKRFSGWVDIDLTEKGLQEAADAGRLMRLHGLEFDEAHVSVLKRAVKTLWTALEHAEQHFIPIHSTWRLNERHYGALTGLSKLEAKEQLGADLLLHYRRGYNTQPPPMDACHPHWPGEDRRYKDLGPLLPRGESLGQCKDRVVPYWRESVEPSLRGGKRVILAAHNNVLRVLCKHLDGIRDDDLDKLELPTGVPLVYKLHPETLEPMGAPDAIGFRGEFLRSAGVGDANLLESRDRSAKQAPQAVGWTPETWKAIAKDSEALELMRREVEGKQPHAQPHAQQPQQPSPKATSPEEAWSLPMARAGRKGASSPGALNVRPKDVVPPEVLMQEVMKLGLKKCPKRESYIQDFAK